MKKDKWTHACTQMLYMPDAELLSMYEQYKIGNQTYGELCIEYKKTLNGIISNCKDGQLILVYIHADFPQQKQDFAIVYKDSYPYSALMRTDDYNVVVDIDEHFKLISKA